MAYLALIVHYLHFTRVFFAVLHIFIINVLKKGLDLHPAIRIRGTISGRVFLVAANKLNSN